MWPALLLAPLGSASVGVELLWTAEGGTEVDVAGDLHCLQERTGFTTWMLSARRVG